MSATIGAIETIDGLGEARRLIEKFSVPEPNTGCWLWMGGVNDKNYGRVDVGGRMCAAHRVSYCAFVGPVAEWLMVRHRCDNPPCVNPDHLTPGTHAQNMADRAARNRTAKGARHGMSLHPGSVSRGEMQGSAKLTDEDVRRIRSAVGSGERGTAVARRFGVSQSTVSLIKLGKHWGHVHG